MSDQTDSSAPACFDSGLAALTGDVVVDAALRAVAEAAGAAPRDQLPAYEATHSALRETLARIDET